MAELDHVANAARPLHAIQLQALRQRLQKRLEPLEIAMKVAGKLVEDRPEL